MSESGLKSELEPGSESGNAKAAVPLQSRPPVSAMRDAEWLSAVEMRDALLHGDVTSRELVQRSLERAEASIDLGAFVSLNGELALEEADAADSRITAARTGGRAAPRGSTNPFADDVETTGIHSPSDAERYSGSTTNGNPDALPPLLGLPTAHKDLVRVRGAVTTHGSLAVPHLVATADDPIAAVVRAAGAVSIGKTQVPEFGITGYSENEVAPPARNPHNPERTAGGSSGGTAAAIAAGIIPAAVASDAGGSIRIPAAACGLVGLKPGRGVVPDGQTTTLDEAGAPRMGVSGPIARTASDAALIFDSIMGRSELAPGPLAESSLRAVERVLADPSELRGLRVGVSLASPFEGWAEILFSKNSLTALNTGIAALEACGHTVEGAEFHYDPRYPEAFTTVWTAALARVPLEPGAENLLGALARMFLDRARATPPEHLAEAATTLRAFAADVAMQWGAYDVVLTPALAFGAPLINEFRALGPEGDYRLQCEWAPQTSMVNVSGLPAITVPTVAASRASDGLPMGVQLIGRTGSESLLLQLAAQITAIELSTGE